MTTSRFESGTLHGQGFIVVISQRHGFIRLSSAL
jgi:hypothetical protein